jgi:hypothetical protein
MVLMPVFLSSLLRSAYAPTALADKETPNKQIDLVQRTFWRTSSYAMIPLAAVMLATVPSRWLACMSACWATGIYARSLEKIGCTEVFGPQQHSSRQLMP